MRRIFSPQLLLVGLFLLAGLIAFSPNLNGYFLSDDFVQIGKVLHGDYAVAWGQEHGGFFRPLFIWSYIIDSHIWGMRPLGYHLTNVMVHALNAFLVFRLAAGLLENIESRKKRTVSIVAGVLFLLHPSHSEAVVWISGRADLLATLFMLLSLLAYLTYEERKREPYLGASLALFAIALLAKESAICTPFLIVVIGLCKRAKLARMVRVCAMFAAVTILFIVIRARFIGSVIGGYGNAQHLNFAPGWLRDRLLEAVVRSILPPLPNAWLTFLFKPLQSPVFYLLVLLIAAATATAILMRRKFYQPAERKNQNRFMFLLAALFLMSLLPILNLRLSLYQTQGERFLYLPTVFACLMIAYVAALLIRRTTICLIVITALLGFYSWSVYRTNLLWRDAAKLSARVSYDVTDAASKAPLVIVNAPDNLRGVPVFHNGLAEAISWIRSNDSAKPIQIVAFQDLQSATDEILISGNDPITVRPVNATDRFSRVTATDCLEVFYASPDAFDLHPKPCASAAKIVFFSGGAIKELKPSLPNRN
jgi:protein O-mannosyl-transferase